MKAAVYYQTGAPDVFRYKEAPEPECPENGVVIEIQAISVEGGDVLNRAGGALASVPHIVGYQSAGLVCEVGPQAQGRRVGQKVVAIGPFGSHAEKLGVAAATTWPIPDGLDLGSAACIPIPFGTADDCLFEFGELKRGETVLVHAGAGGVGMAAIQLAKAAGATVLATASSNAKLDRLKPLGLDHGINYAETDFVAATRDLTGGRGPDLVIDSIGGQNLQRSIECAAYRGRIISVGGAGRDPTPPDVSLLAAGNKRLTGVFLGAEIATAHARVYPMIQRHIEAAERGDLRIEIDRTFPLAEAAKAHAFIESRQAVGRVLLIP
jgi:NADPH2:quinone reductase